MDTATIVIDAESLIDRPTLEQYAGLGLISLPMILDDASNEEHIGQTIRSLSAKPLSLLRVIVVRAGRVEVTSEINTAEARLVRRLRQEADVANTQLVRGVLVSPEPGTTLGSLSFHADWDFNILLPRRHATGVQGHLSNEFDRSAHDQISWSLFLALGLGCGIFTFLREGLFDQSIGSGPTHGEATVRVADLYVRVIDCGDAVTELVGRVLQGEDDQWPVPEELIEGADSSQVVAQLARQSCERLNLIYTPISREAEAGKTQSALASIALFMKQLLFMGHDEVSTATFRRLDHAVSRLERKIQQTTLGKDAVDTVAMTQGRASSKNSNMEQRLSLLEAMPDVSLPSAAAESRVWSSLRQVALSIVDGGDFPQELSDIQPERDNRRVVVPQRRLVIEPPVDNFAGLESTNNAEFETADDTHGEVLDEDLVGVDSPDRSFWQQVEHTLDQSTANAWSSLTAMQTLWADSRDQLINSERLAKRNRRWVKWMTLFAYLALTATIVGLAWLLQNNADEVILERVGYGGGALFVVAVLGAGFALSRFKGHINKIKRAFADSEHAESEHQNAASNFARFGYLRIQAADWRQILASVVHRPLGITRSLEEPRVLKSPAIQNLGIATPDFDSQSWQRTTLDLRRHLNSRGWLNQMYLRNLQVWQDRDAKIRNPSETREQDPELDRASEPRSVSIPGTKQNLHNPRHQFARDIGSDQHAAEAFKHFRVDVGDVCRRVIIDTGLESVSVMVNGADPISVDSFLGDILRQPSNSVLELFGSDAVERERLTTKAAAVSGVSPSAINDQPLVEGFDHHNVTDVSELIVLASYRAHLSGECSLGSLAVLEDRASPTNWVAPEQDDGPVL